ncbi:hypothetical protein E8L99_11330 [Phreatobacter aquaticus]|uniref:Haemin-degrading HemS/ChuX domain-containing protein n=1 Tax=Phreatobacter aquaticus TaxID=2570229 RepID=A0A4D7QK10_9HYPH|nr:hypothetical protein [Phreatobacter aquaticus]QCK86303.1 hypothetical protein E8L99_11330 [Phreatobacter aquaticus]
MTTDTRPIREALTCGVAAALACTRGMGRVMLSVSDKGTTHERIGVVDRVVADTTSVTLSGSAHDARIDLSIVTAVVVDRSGKMRDKAMPRLEFQDSAGTALFSVIGLEGIEPFDQALAGVEPGTTLPEKLKPVPSGGGQAADVDPEDVGARPLHAARENGDTVSIIYRGNGLEQRWSGTIAEIKPMMGFFNIIQTDFHLHLKAGAVSRWRQEPTDVGVELHAQDGEGRDIGLVLRGPANLS